MFDPLEKKQILTIHQEFFFPHVKAQQLCIWRLMNRIEKQRINKISCRRSYVYRKKKHVLLCESGIHVYILLQTG